MKYPKKLVWLVRASKVIWIVGLVTSAVILTVVVYKVMHKSRQHGDGPEAARRELAERGIPYDAGAFIQTAHNGDFNAIGLFLATGMNVNVRDEYQRTALMLAASSDQAVTAQVLLDKGADINATDKDGKTALMFASQIGEEDIVRLLLDEGADPSLRAKDGSTALIIAERERYTKVVDSLRKAGAKE